MESDDRFKHLVSDPRFKNLRKKQRKVQIDERFKSMFTDERFGRRENLKKFYEIEDKEPLADERDNEVVEEDAEEKGDPVSDHTNNQDDNEESESDEGDDDEQVEDEEGEEDQQSASGRATPESELSSSSDESESDDEIAEEADPEQIQYDWQPLDHDAERAEIKTKRIAILNLDWNNLDIQDIYVLLNSIRSPLSVKLYISEFGKEKLAKEEVEGPDLPEIDEVEEELNILEDHMSGIGRKANEYEDADEMFDSKNEAIRERLRQYQLTQMKYYYAIAEFDSVESAQAVYKELDGIEYEGSSLELDLRFVPDDTDFDPADMKAECNRAPDLATYKAPQFIASALQQTTVKFNWDATDVKRQEKLHKAYTKEELEKDDLEAYLASDTESEGEHEGANKYKALLMELDRDEANKSKVNVDVQWNDDDEDVDSADDGDDDEDDDEEKDEMEQDEHRVKGSDKKNVGSQNDERNDDCEDDAALDLLVMDSAERENFKFNPDDERFKAVYESGLYNIDPSHPRFKRSEAFNQIAERKREKRRRVQENPH